MVQEFHVLRCFSCQTFQVQQVKKVNRWTCKLCGEKQSLLKEFGRGSGADCRRHVQKLNAMRGALMEEQEHNIQLLRTQVEEDGEPEDHRADQVTQTQVSCWSKYLDTPEEAEPAEEEEECVLMDEQQLHGNGMIDRCDLRECGVVTGRGHPPVNQQSDFCLQSSWSRLTKNPVRPSATTRPTSLNHTSPPSKKSMNAPSVSGGPLTRWACFLRSDCKVNEEGEEPSISGWTQSVGGAALLSCNDIIHHSPPPVQPRPLLPVSSMFESGEDFSFDEFLTADKL
ncbi:MRN complex-interacting protein [Chaetodon trifascialis]|uniref:MRN complex-interacting protein n=1 Tax=Chaetodon trifascialis TaxID=109706 RepID=UPI003991B3C4